MDHILIDTDVILDFFFDRQPFSEFSSNVFSLCEQKKILGYTTPLIIANTYYLLRKTAKHEIIVNKLHQLLSFIDVIEMNKNTVINALNSHFKDFEDALQNFSAIQTNSITIILTRNTKDFKKSELVVMTPETYVKGRR